MTVVSKGRSRKLSELGVGHSSSVAAATYGETSKRLPRRSLRRRRVERWMLELGIWSFQLPAAAGLARLLLSQHSTAASPARTNHQLSPAHVIDQETFEDLLPLACQWAKAQEEFILARGASLTPRHTADARRVGVQGCSKVKVLVVDRIPLPENEQLAEAARRTHIITDASRGVAIGHGILIRADCWGDRELLVHQLVHVAQCERSGGLEPFVRDYLCDRQTCANFTIGSLEGEARGIAREICAADAAVG